MTRKKKSGDKAANNYTRVPLFSGDSKRDSAASESEKVSEISLTVFDWIVRKIKNIAK